MSNQTTCPECGSPLPANTPEGLCPACLLKRGLDPNTVGYTLSQSESARWNPPTPQELAPRFPELEILELIGRGGMGAVYKARQKNLDRLVALKILPPEIGRDPAFADRFAREAQAMAKLNHPHIVAIYEFGQRDGLFFFLMEFVDGLSLRQLLSTGTVSPKEALAIVPQICDALQYAHDQGIVHRDIKPENILLNKQGQVKIADFGLAKLMGQSSATLAPEKVIGTPQYMAPEQMHRPNDVDHRADIYALGVVFYQMLTGELPSRKIEPPSKKVLIDVRLDEVVLRALETEPQRRYQQASQMKTEIETISTMPHITSTGGKVDGKPPLSPAKLLAAIIGLALLILLLLVIGVTFMWHNWRTTTMRQQVVVATQHVNEDETRKRNIPQAEQFVDLMSQGLFAKATEFFDATMKQAVSPKQLEEVWKQLEQVGGRYQGRGTSRAATENGFDVIYVPGRWERNQIDFKVVFDKQGQITGLWTVPPSSRTTSATQATAPAKDLAVMVADAVETVSTCAEGDLRIAPAIGSLKGLDPVAVVTELTKFLASNVNEVRRAAIYILWHGQFSSIDPAVPQLLLLCKHQEDVTRGMAAVALGGNRVEASFPTLVEMLTKDTSGYARRCAAYALGLLGNKDAVPVLQKALNDPDKTVAAPAKAALKMLAKASTTPATRLVQSTRISPDQVAVEDLALEILVAIREKDDAKLQKLAVDKIKGWRDALPHFAIEMRERFAQMTGKPFTMYPAESLVQKDRAVVKCTGPKELGGVYLVLFFIKTDTGWRNWSLRNSPANKPLSDYLKVDPDASPTSRRVP